MRHQTDQTQPTGAHTRGPADLRIMNNGEGCEDVKHAFLSSTHEHNVTDVVAARIAGLLS